MYIYTHIHRYIYIYAHIHTYAYIFMHAYICIHIYICIHTCVCVHKCPSLVFSDNHFTCVRYGKDSTGLCSILFTVNPRSIEDPTKRNKRNHQF